MPNRDHLDSNEYTGTFMEAAIRKTLLCCILWTVGCKSPDRFGLGVRDEPMFPLWKYR